MKNLFICLLLAGLCEVSYSQKIAAFEMKMLQPDLLSTPASMNLDEITFLPDSVLSLVEVDGNKKTPVACQIDHTAGPRMLHWMVEPGREKQTYELLNSATTVNANTIRAEKDTGTLIFKSNNKNLLSYYYINRVSAGRY